MTAKPVRSFLASPRVGAGFTDDAISPKPSKASFILSLFGMIRSCLGRSIREPVKASGLITETSLVALGVVYVAVGCGLAFAELGSEVFQSFSAKSSPNPAEREVSVFVV
jgi:hypothetical protein